jgi:hypothetical protein
MVPGLGLRAWWLTSYIQSTEGSPESWPYASLAISKAPRAHPKADHMLHWLYPKHRGLTRKLTICFTGYIQSTEGSPESRPYASLAIPKASRAHPTPDHMLHWLYPTHRGLTRKLTICFTGYIQSTEGSHKYIYIYIYIYRASGLGLSA